MELAGTCMALTGQQKSPHGKTVIIYFSPPYTVCIKMVCTHHRKLFTKGVFCQAMQFHTGTLVDKEPAQDLMSQPSRAAAPCCHLLLMIRSKQRGCFSAAEL